METQSAVPYQAYKSKRHSRNTSTLSSNAGDSSPSRSASSIGFTRKINESPVLADNGLDEKARNGIPNGVARPALSMLDTILSQDNNHTVSPSSSSPVSPSFSSPQIPIVPPPNSDLLINGQNSRSSPELGPPSSSSVEVDTTSLPIARRTSTFRRRPLHDARSSLPSPLRSSSHIQAPNSSPLRKLADESSTFSNSTTQRAPTSMSHPISEPTSSPSPPKPPPKVSSPAPSIPATPSPQSRPNSTGPSIAPPNKRSAPFYRPGFQPNGVAISRTEEFLEARGINRDNGRIELTRLERRLEKLIHLHFSDTSEKPVALLPMKERRASSFFELDFSDLKNKGAGDLWKGILQSQTQGSKGDIRSAEQKITPWEEDASVSQCPLCHSSFHPITNRKHHCRLCGRIICSSPVKLPQRPMTCSLLFVADPQTGQIEEVGEGVDYGIRRRTIGQNTGPTGRDKGKQQQPGDDEKFLKGVRICRDCRPVLLRQQYIKEANSTPVFSNLYDGFIVIEKEIEDALPQFQELILTLKNDEQPTAEASAARKRLLEAFAQYDTLAKQIRNLHCLEGPGSSQDRVQTAILTRANLFLQKHMFPLQSLPKPAKRSKPGTPTSSSQGPLLDSNIDPDSELAHALQPLLEQEALLETFVQEAKSHRKFEDAQTLKTNLQEIRAEIDRIMANADRAGKQAKQR